MDYIAVRGFLANQQQMMAAVFPHNFNRELQMEIRPPDRASTEKQAPRWVFEGLRSLRRRLIQ
jgi:hypothetical protein